MILKCKKEKIFIEDKTSVAVKLEELFKQHAVIGLEKENGDYVAITPTGDESFCMEYKENGKAFLCLNFYSKGVVTDVFLKFFQYDEHWHEGFEWEEVSGGSLRTLIFVIPLMSFIIAFYGWSIGQTKQFGIVAGTLFISLIFSLLVIKDPKSTGFTLSFMKNMLDGKDENSKEDEL